MDKIKNLVNIIGFHLGWWACVLAVQAGIPYLGPIVMTLFLFIHILFFKLNQSEFFFIALVSLFGAFIDTAFLQASLIEYRGLTFDLFAPFWIISMWAGFAATLNHSLYWLAEKWLLAFLMGAIFGPLSYLAGIKFGALNFNPNFKTLGILAIVWGIVLPSLYKLNQKIVRINESK